MKKIPLTQGQAAIVDDEDYEWLMQWKWTIDKRNHTFYAIRRSSCKLGKRKIFMHREILGLTKGDGKQTDHKNHNGLDNRRINIRICTGSQNQHNQKKQKGNSKYKGVCWNKYKKKWQAQIEHNNQCFYLGSFLKEIDAAKAYDKKARKLNGEFACLNFGR